MQNTTLKQVTKRAENLKKRKLVHEVSFKSLDVSWMGRWVCGWLAGMSVGEAFCKTEIIQKSHPMHGTALDVLWKQYLWENEDLKLHSSFNIFFLTHTHTHTHTHTGGGQRREPAECLKDKRRGGHHCIYIYNTYAFTRAFLIGENSYICSVLLTRYLSNKSLFKL